MAALILLIEKSSNIHMKTINKTQFYNFFSKYMNFFEKCLQVVVVFKLYLAKFLKLSGLGLKP